MATGLLDAHERHGVTVIACTNRRDYLDNLFRNYARQTHAVKELVVVVNNDRIPLAPYRRMAGKHRNVRIYRMPEHRSLGACLNFAVGKARYGRIAKFDDDDYYAPYYLTDSLRALRAFKADVVGKRAHYMYLRGARKLILRFGRDENKPVGRLPGATLVFRKRVFERARFPDRSVGEDDLFCDLSRRQGYRVYSGGRFNFVAVRRKNSANHTWIIGDRELLAHNRTIPNVTDYKRYVRRKPRSGR
ncbi:glycosyltransferase [Cohnella hashimotonis]|uniref:Glycosyltransferase family A protein n=1 Tax=Cohnella hashimotonis TaxID=2826895 RepID=A0ABT6TQK6_9BACL|nr:glycosyltransferase family A protein [Cohnella hashimotonis]